LKAREQLLRELIHQLLSDCCTLTERQSDLFCRVVSGTDLFNDSHGIVLLGDVQLTVCEDATLPRDREEIRCFQKLLFQQPLVWNSLLSLQLLAAGDIEVAHSEFANEPMKLATLGVLLEKTLNLQKGSSYLHIAPGSAMKRWGAPGYSSLTPHLLDNETCLDILRLGA